MLGGKGVKILVIDDDPLLRRTLMRGLSEHAVSTAQNCSEARSFMRKDRFDLVLSDLHLGDGLGTELHRWLVREKIEFGCFALMSGSPMRGEERRRLSELECPVLEKPFGRKAVEDLLVVAQNNINRNVS